MVHGNGSGGNINSKDLVADSGVVGNDQPTLLPLPLAEEQPSRQ